MSDGVRITFSSRDWHPEVLAVLLVLLGIYFYCVGPLRERYGLAPHVERRHTIYALLAAFSVWLAEGTPLHTLSERYLFSAHMLQHALLVLIMPPLLIHALPPWLISFILRPRWLAWIARILTRPLVTFLAFNGVYAAWHLPMFYELPLMFHWVHVVQHITFMVTAIMMWWPLLSPSPELPRLSYGGQLVYVFGHVVAQLPVFAPITFATDPIYSYYAEQPRLLGMSALEDQQWAGIIMKLGTMGVLLVVVAFSFFRWAKNDGVESPAELARRQPYPEHWSEGHDTP